MARLLAESVCANLIMLHIRYLPQLPLLSTASIGRPLSIGDNVQFVGTMHGDMCFIETALGKVSELGVEIKLDTTQERALVNGVACRAIMYSDRSDCMCDPRPPRC